MDRFKATASAVVNQARRSPLEMGAALAVSPFVFTVIKNLFTRNIKDVDQGPEEDDYEQETVSLRGRTFTSKTPKVGAVDLSWWGALPFYVTPLLLSFEAIGLWLEETNWIRSKNISPKVRMKIQFWIFFGVLPLADLIIGSDWKNPTKQQVAEYRGRWRFRLPLYLYVAVSTLLNLSVYRAVFSRAQLNFYHRLQVLATLTLLNGAFGITISHELIHKGGFEEILGKLLLVFVNYVHWGEEHFNHHEHVATPKDPATARFSESLYAFLPRTIIGSFQSSCNLEAKRLAEQGLEWWTVQNRIFQGIGASAAWSMVLARHAKSMWAIPTFYLSAFVSASLLEVVNFIEHWGLERRMVLDENGEPKFEPVNPTHSHNSPHHLSNVILFKLQRHSDHHFLARRPYELLRNFVESPQLPAGYPGMFALAFFPPLFNAVMGPLVISHRIQFNPDREPTEDERKLVKKLRRQVMQKMWAFTTVSFLGTTYFVVRF